eukprot:2638857-Prymnesium_polylepis.1
MATIIPQMLPSDYEQAKGLDGLRIGEHPGASRSGPVPVVSQVAASALHVGSTEDEVDALQCAHIQSFV